MEREYRVRALILVGDCDTGGVGYGWLAVKVKARSAVQAGGKVAAVMAERGWEFDQLAASAVPVGRLVRISKPAAAGEEGR